MTGGQGHEHDGVTNTVWEEDDGTIQKRFSRFPWTVGVMDALHLPFRDISVTTREQRVANELAAKDHLQTLGIPTQSVIDQEGWTVTLENVPGVPLDSVLQDASTEDRYDIGYRKGRELRALHDAGHAYRDCRCGNTIIGDELYSIDHELFESAADGHHQMMDLLTLLGTAKRFPRVPYRTFAQGVRTGYDGTGPYPRVRTVLELPCALGYALIVDRTVRSMVNVLSNWVRDRTID